MSFKGFLSKHAGELGDITSVLSTVVSLLPIGSQDKKRITKVTDGLNDAAGRIERAATDMPDLGDGIDRDELRTIVREELRAILPDMLGGVVEATARQANPARRRKAARQAARAAEAAPTPTPAPKAKRAAKAKA